MPDYRRTYQAGGTYFFTVVTYHRQPHFKVGAAVDLLRECFEATMRTHPFRLDAFAILPDHLHTIWTLPDNDSDFSTRWNHIKGSFSHRYHGHQLEDLGESMQKKRERGIWQRRFWEHTVRDQEDFNRHCDYIHYNPVKHGLVSSPADWQHSSFNRFVEKGLYEGNWGQSPVPSLLDMDME